MSRHKSIDSVSRLLLRSSLHNVARLAGHESFDIVDQLIRQNLHSFLAGPSDVRSYNEVRQIQIQEPAVGGSLVRTSNPAPPMMPS